MRIACLALLLAATAAVAQDDSKAPAPADSFQAIHTQWRNVLTELRQLQERYQTAGASEKAKIETQFNERLAEGKKLQPKLLVAAEKEFVAAPNKNKEVSDFLVDRVAQLFAESDHKEALRLAQVLVDNKVEDKRLASIAGHAAFSAGDYEAAERHYAAAAAAKTLDAEGQAYRAEAKIRAAEAKADDLPRVKLTTSKGDIVVELFENEAPNTVANFISLVEKKFYDGLTFHRVLEGFMAQGGDPKGDGTGGPGYAIACECTKKNHRLHFPATLSMAHAGQDTGGSQFFLTFVRTKSLDGRHTVFGRVIEGADVLAKIQRIDPQAPDPSIKPDKIIKATVVRKRDHPYKPETLPER
jgi:cyclophilin family peptidyl-prolyl cis-trans isomerase